MNEHNESLDKIRESLDVFLEKMNYHFEVENVGSVDSIVDRCLLELRFQGDYKVSSDHFYDAYLLMVKYFRYSSVPENEILDYLNLRIDGLYKESKSILSKFEEEYPDEAYEWNSDLDYFLCPYLLLSQEYNEITKIKRLIQGAN